ncbi:cupin domain-containing protein [Sinomicrobium pectinilyticum]|uniref:Cupin domain-containing protein n=1 Tax=Sinomicrobium pectinilyticum TaxID=1084421 RepID=A0A3N0E7R5_SINP1|nr:cupin domain-containing protein [Sinomicrobium pectinilyticum]RNL83912.1 cupin domain-containing protein [Sinomicrobium pectinilyticum]
MNIHKVNLQSEVDKVDKHWVLKEIAQVNDHLVRIIKLKGAFEMHRHNNGDKLFYVVNGTLFVEFADGHTQEVNTGEFVVIPKNVAQKPFAAEEVSLMLFEPK